MSNSLDAVLSQYEKNKQEAFRPKQTKMTEEERLQKYFSPQLGKTETSGEATVRILPVKEGSPFVQVFFHEVKLGGKWVKLYDPGTNEGKPSPLNDTHAALMIQVEQKGKDSKEGKELKELAKQYRAKKFWIVKLIDRANEAHGPKFYRFKDSWKNDGTLDKIIPIYRKKGDIADPETGRDLTLILTKQSTPDGRVTYTAVTGVMVEDPSPLHKDAEIAKAWLDDPMTWENVYSKKPLDYLQGVAQGYEPKWSIQMKKYTWGNDTEEGADLTSTTNSKQFLEEDADDVEGGSETSVEDDLPF
jgi:hypothetical protein